MGCVFTELFTKELLFKADNSKDILAKIIVTVRNYSEHDLEFIEDDSAVDFIKGFERIKKFELANILRDVNATEEGIYCIN